MADHDTYREYCAEVNKNILSNSEAFDKAILTLSSAGLGLSLTFFKFVVPAKDAVNLELLERGWFLFLGAIISTMISFISSQQAHKKEIEYAEKYYLEELKEYENKNNPAANLTDALNIFSGILFISALVSIVLFVTNNI